MIDKSRDLSCAHDTREQRILAELLEVSAVERVTRDVHRGRVHAYDALRAHLFAHGKPRLSRELGIERLREHYLRGETAYVLEVSERQGVFGLPKLSAANVPQLQRATMVAISSYDI